VWFILIILDGRRIEKRNKVYNDLEKCDELNGRIIDIDIIKGYCYVTTEQTKMVIHSSQNYLYSDEYISDNIFLGDSIIKDAGSDTIRIIRDRSEFYFVHKKVINRHLK